ncbi:hypothetical protein [Woodsholea maritima]|uniref:hypothetical protein n=1 Tax=Woodsholea maritima TaxID=240237 RepID=UPI0003771316|nr:hypothetical protein [Woodsholea maritima]
MTQSTDDLRQHLASFLLDLADKNQSVEGWQNYSHDEQNQLVTIIKRLYDALSLSTTAPLDDLIESGEQAVTLPQEGIAGADFEDLNPLGELGISFSPRICPVCQRRMPLGKTTHNPAGCTHCGQ